jgi:hypothetical protein
MTFRGEIKVNFDVSKEEQYYAFIDELQKIVAKVE